MNEPADARTRRRDTETKTSGTSVFRRRAVEQTDEWTNDLEREGRSDGRTDENVNERRCRKTKTKVTETSLFRRLPNPQTPNLGRTIRSGGTDGQTDEQANSDDVKKNEKSRTKFVLAASPNPKNQEIPTPDPCPLNPNP